MEDIPLTEKTEADLSSFHHLPSRNYFFHPEFICFNQDFALKIKAASNVFQ